MTLDEIIGAIVGIIMIITLSVCLISVVIMYANNDIKENKRKAQAKEYQKHELLKTLTQINYNLYCINNTLKTNGGAKRNEKN